MITKDMKISRLLEEYPGSLEALVRVSPHFRKLENKMLRKALAGRVTVEQAAKVAGVELDFLLTELNRSSESIAALRAEEAETQPAEDTAASEEKLERLRNLSPGKIVTLDVRPILDSGKDPLKDIFSKVKELQEGEVLLILNTFEPVPLYSRMQDKGFSHFTETEAGLWKVYFFRETEAVEKENAPAVLPGIINIEDYENVIEVDVHDLPAPEPMVKILESLSRIDDKSVMLVRHHREPNLLYPRLEERGYMASCTKLGEESYQILIAKKKV